MKLFWIFYSFLSNCFGLGEILGDKYLMQRVKGQSLARGHGSRGTRNEEEILTYNFRCFIVLVKVWNPHLQGPKSSGSLTVSTSHYSDSTKKFHPKPGKPLLSEWLLSSLHHGLTGLHELHLHVHVNSQWALFALFCYWVVYHCPVDLMVSSTLNWVERKWIDWHPNSRI